MRTLPRAPQLAVDNSAGGMNSTVRSINSVGDPGSRFHGLRNSMRMHHVFLRFGASSLVCATIDNLVFYVVYRATGTIAGAQISARAVSVIFNYLLVHRAVFVSDQHHHVALPRYLGLIVFNAVLAYVGIRFLSAFTPLSVFASKIAAETLLFAANFAMQRRFIFAHHAETAPPEPPSSHL